MDDGNRILRFGGRSAEENLTRAIELGTLRADPSGQLHMGKPWTPKKWNLVVRPIPNMHCWLHNAFLFDLAYAGATVPSGCRACYKIKVIPPTLRALVALRGILETGINPCKCGVDFFNPHSRDFYAAYFYYEGLEAARTAYPALRAEIDADPHLGPTVPMVIKRGCSNYEAACGPSDHWNFPDGIEDLESTLRSRFETTVPMPAEYRLRRIMTTINWINFAYWIKDDTYLDFTYGKPLYPPTVNYHP